MLNIGIIGLGLIGGSLAMALKRNGGCRLMGTDNHRPTIEMALNRGIIDQEIIAGDVSDCEIVFICTPLSSIQSVLDEIKSHLKAQAIVSDVGSVKGPVMDWFARQLPPGVIGIGGHPMAGSDKSGIEAADPHLFENAVWILTPPAQGSTAGLATLTQLLAGTGAVIRVMAADKHDQAVSQVSHLPHLTAVCLVNSLMDSECVSLAGGGFRDTTRIAGSQADLWADILLCNRDQVMNSIDSLMEELSRMRNNLKGHDRPGLIKALQAARKRRELIPQRREMAERAVDIIAMVPDQPGIIGRVGMLLGDAGININDMQILGARDLDEGSLRITVPEKQAAQAIELLNGAEFRSWIRD